MLSKFLLKLILIEFSESVNDEIYFVCSKLISPILSNSKKPKLKVPVLTWKTNLSSVS